MGQYWQVIAFTQQERLETSAYKLVDLLFGGSPSSLVLPLAVPVLPQPFDLTQASNVTSLGLIGKHNAGKAENLRKGDGLSPEEHEADFISTKSHSVEPKQDNSPKPTESGQKRRSSIPDDSNLLPVIKGTCGLSRFPNELLDMIFQNLAIEDVFVLGLQSQNLWNVARRHIQAHFAPSCGPWAGKGIICVGDYSEPAEYPKILTESEKEELQKEMSEIDDIEKDERFRGPTNLYHLANVRYQQVRDWQSSRAVDLIIHARKLGEWYSLPSYRRSRIYDELDRYKMSDFYPENQPWILRNLTTQEYVRSEAIAVKPEYIHGPNIDGLGFGEVVWSRICWSTDANCAMNSNIHRGVWAGHRFDITTLDRHKQGFLEGTEWKDVSEEVANWVESIWRNELGENWRDMIQEDVLRSRNRPLARCTYLE